MLHLTHLPNAIQGEKIVYCLRRHPVTQTSLFFSFVVLLATPFLGYWYLTTYQSELMSNPTAITLLLWGGSIFFLFAWLFLYQAYSDYVLDLWIVTNKRILSIEQKGLFGRTVSELRLYRVQDVTATISGFFHTMFDYGYVEIQTAAEKNRFIFEEVPNPNLITKTILELSESDRQEHLDEAVEELGQNPEQIVKEV